MSETMCGVQQGALSTPSETVAPPVAADNVELFKSDEFRCYCMKVLPCSKRYTHDWPSCPFAHPGEKAKRRDPRTHQYDCEMCPAVLKGDTCELGAACPHSHHVFEAWLHPQKYRTLLCKDGDQCHREVCFFAHGSKQLRTPDRSHQQPHQQQLAQQRYAPKGPPDSPAVPSRPQHQQGARGKPAAGAGRGASAHAAQAPEQQPPPYAASSCSAVSMLTGSSNSSTSTGMSSSTLTHLTAHSLSAPRLGSGDFAARQQQQHLDPLLATLGDPNVPAHLQAVVGTTGSGDGTQLCQLVRSLVAEVTASKQEAAQSNHAAAVAQQRLQLFEQALGCNLGAGGPGYAAASPSPGACGTPFTSPSVPGQVSQGSSWHTAAAAASAAAAAQQQLLGGHWQRDMHMQQQMVAHGSYDGTYPRRHSLDESLLRRVRNMHGMPGSSNMINRAGGAWLPDSSSAMPNLAAVVEGVVQGPTSGSAASDIEALAAVFTAAGLRSSTDLSAAHLASMQGGGLVSDSVLLGHAAAGMDRQLAGSGNWMGAAVQAMETPGQLPWPQQGAGWAPVTPGQLPWPQQGAGWAPVQQSGAFNSFVQLQEVPPSCQAMLSADGTSLSMPHLQSSDYLLQLQAMLQGNAPMPAPALDSVAGPVRASFDAGASYLPTMPGDILSLSAHAVSGAGMAPPQQEDMAPAASCGSTRESNICSAGDATGMASGPENPTGGANQMGWF